MRVSLICAQGFPIFSFRIPLFMGQKDDHAWQPDSWKLNKTLIAFAPV